MSRVRRGEHLASQKMTGDVVPDPFFSSCRNFIWDLALSKLYSNTILSTLNSRGGWKATSVTQDNVLFGRGTASGVESMAKSRTQVGGRQQVSRNDIFDVNFAQVEIVTTVTSDQPRRVSGAVAMKVLDSEASYIRDDSCSEVNTVPAFARAV